MEIINKNNKKFFHFLFILLFFTSVFTLTGSAKEEAAAASSTAPQISYSLSGEPVVNSTVTITINVTNASKIYGGSLDFILDNSILEVQKVNMGTLFAKDIKKPLLNYTNDAGITSILMTLSGANKSLSTTSGSLVVITAKVKKEGIVNIKTTNDLSKVSLAGYTSCIKFAGENASKLSYGYSDTQLTFTKPFNSIEENNPQIKYTGAWSNAASSIFSGGAVKTSNSTTASMKFAFTGTGIELISSPAFNRGIANVNIDGTNYSVDLYSSTLKAKTSVFKITNLTNSTHNITITPKGTKNNSSSGNIIVIDAFNIFNGNITNYCEVNSIDDTNPYINYIGSWPTASSNIFVNGSVKTSNSTAASMSFSFTGTGIEFISSPAFNRGIANVNIDGTNYSVDLYSSTLKSKVSVFKITTLAKGTHKITITPKGIKNASSSGNIIVIDAFNILNGNIVNSNKDTSVEENNSHIKYTGTWSDAASSIFSGGAVKISNSTAASMSFSFTGTGIEFISSPAFNRGIANVNIDGTNYSVDLYSTTLKAKTSVFKITNLAQGTHKITITPKGTKNASSSGNIIVVDAFNIFNGNIQ